MISAWVADRFFWVFLVFILINVMQRRRQERARRKRLATFFLAIAAFFLMFVAQLIVSYGGTDFHFLVAVVVTVLVMYRFRAYTFPFRLYSPVDGRRYSWEEIAFLDDPDLDGDTDPERDRP